jgi:hypothetical protein
VLTGLALDETVRTHAPLRNHETAAKEQHGMKKTILLTVLGLFAFPVSALADEASSSSAQSSASATCKSQLATLGAATFKLTYGTGASRANAFGKCVSRNVVAAAKAAASAAQQCKAEGADPGFAAAHDGKTFAQLYGSGPNGRNALGRCVSGKTKQATDAQAAATAGAAKQCRTEQGDPGFAAAHGGKTFAQHYGTGPSRANAFGRCVAAKASQA